MIRVALVGCGRIAVRHAELLTGDHLPEASLAAVCDTDYSKAEVLGSQHEVPFFGDMHDMMKTVPDIDAVAVLTESGNHAQNAIDLAPYGKHLILEKPMALTLDDADNVIRTCDENGIRLFVVKQNRFNVPIMKLREALEQGRFGRIVMGTVRVRWCRPQHYYDQADWRGTWALDGGVLTNQASHHIDALEWMLGEPESVFAYSRTALVNIETEDTAVVVVKFRDGALGVIEATTATRPKDLEGSLSILGERGTVEVAGFALNEMRTWNFSEAAAGDDKILAEYSTNPPDVYGFGHKAFYEHVIDCLNTGNEQLVDGLEARKSLELIMAIYESIETGMEVKLRFTPRLCKLGMSDD